MNWRLAATAMKKEIADRHAWNPVQQPKDPLSIWHLCYLVDQLTKVQFTEGKASRWLGWAQAVYCLHGFGTLESLKALNEGCSCEDEGCPQFGTVHVHVEKPTYKEGYYFLNHATLPQRTVGHHRSGYWFLVGDDIRYTHDDIVRLQWRPHTFLGEEDLTPSED